MAESQAYEAWKAIEKQRRDAIIDDLLKRNTCQLPKPGELLTETDRIEYARKHARYEFILELKNNGN